MRLKKLPLGKQTLRDIINDDMLYIDKTKIALDLIESYTYTFLSRPRRFGKSLFVSTLREIFEGNKEIFKDLYIYDKWDWSVKYPVIDIDFSGDMRSPEALKRTILAILKNNQEDLEIKCSDTEEYANCFEELIKKTYKKYNQKVVILIDEYDKGILDNLDQIEIADQNREILRSFYSKMKTNDKYIKFVFITGVSRFAKASIFSGLNMLKDISLQSQYGEICGYTQNDIETTLLPYLEGVDLDELKEWYDGYNFLGKNLYNPYGILLFIDGDKMYKNYWFGTATPTFLIKLIKQQNYFLPKLGNTKVGEEILDSFDTNKMKFEIVLFQAGYLTIEKEIKKRRGGFEYHLKVPNKEVQIALNDSIINNVIKQPNRKSEYQDSLYDALYDANLEDFRDTLISIFASIPYNNYTNNDIAHFEGFYATVIYVYLASLGIEIVGEAVTNRGRIDLTVKLNTNIFI
ncbi:AAA family ATPase, partial [Sulfurovum sp. bin170]|uniref:ATP-binding protein n=1 Tax=Sulfurovum sp. bin170 TaxID=2695268 RepID=UPI0013E08C90